MLGNTTLIQQSLAHGLGGQQAGGNVRRAAVQQFWRLLLRARVGRAWSRLTGRPRPLQDLAAAAAAAPITGRRHLGLQLVPLAQIAGSEGRHRQFDADFRPLAHHTLDRWANVAVAWNRGAALPPVTLVQLGSRYFVRDGHHRLSVAHSRGLTEIEAEVTRWECEG